MNKKDDNDTRKPQLPLDPMADLLTPLWLRRYRPSNNTLRLNQTTNKNTDKQKLKTQERKSHQPPD
jgi:hypothetical protein